MAAAFAFWAVACGSGDGESPADWSFASQMLHRRSYAASAQIDGKIYVAAGMVGETGKPLDFLERFDPSRNEWASLPPVPEAFSAAAGASFQGRFWITGGNSREVKGRQVYSYDLTRERWRKEAPLPATRTNHAALSFNGKLYVIGGLDPFNPTRTVFVYDPGTKRWSRGTPLPVALHGHSAAVFRGEIWVFGGRVRSLERQRGVWIYNAEDDRWRAGPSLPEKMDTLATSVTDDRIDAIVDDFYFIFDGDKGEWRSGPTLNIPRHALATYTIDGTLYAVGGCIYPQLRDSPIVEKIPVPAA
jgi:N-acetylneuraminic acid mutarotase